MAWRSPPVRGGRRLNRVPGSVPGLALGLVLGALLAVSAVLVGAPAVAAPAGDGYRFDGRPTSGGSAPEQAPVLAPGKYTDTIDPDQTRWYAVQLDATSAADLSATAVPKPGATVDYGDGLELKLVAGGTYDYTCDTQSAHFGQVEGAMNLTGAVSRIPSQDHAGQCDAAGRYLLSVHRTSAAGSDQARWPIELTFGTEAPLPAGTVPAAARTDYGTAPAPVTGTPKDVTGGTGFNDAATVGTGVWRSGVLPAQVRYYKVRLGWGQQLTYAAEFANEQAGSGSSGSGSSGGSAGGTAFTFVTTSLYAPGRVPVEDASDTPGNRTYDGSAPASVGLGTVPVTWTNRWVAGGAATEVHRAGDYWIAVGLGPDAAKIAPDTAVGVVLRVRVSGAELAGPQYRAPVLAGQSGTGDTADAKAGTSGGAPSGSPAGVQADGSADSGGSGGGPLGITGTDLLAAGTGGAVALAGLAVAVLVHRSGARTRTRTDRGGV